MSINNLCLNNVYLNITLSNEDIFLKTVAKICVDLFKLYKLNTTHKIIKIIS